MRNIVLAALTFLGMAFTTPAVSQVSVNINLGVPPLWGPYGYDDARYYYMPDIDVYYDIWDERYMYYDRGRWILVPVLPPRFAYYDFYSGYKVVLDFCGPNPYRYWRQHRNDYYCYRNYYGPRQYTYQDRGGRFQANHDYYGRRRQYYTAGRGEFRHAENPGHVNSPRPSRDGSYANRSTGRAQPENRTQQIGQPDRTPAVNQQRLERPQGTNGAGRGQGSVERQGQERLERSAQPNQGMSRGQGGQPSQGQQRLERPQPNQGMSRGQGAPQRQEPQRMERAPQQNQSRPMQQSPGRQMERQAPQINRGGGGERVNRGGAPSQQGSRQGGQGQGNRGQGGRPR